MEATERNVAQSLSYIHYSGEVNTWSTVGFLGVECKVMLGLTELKD